MCAHQSYLSPLEYSRWAPNGFFALLAGGGRYRGLVACGAISAVWVVMPCVAVRRPGANRPLPQRGAHFLETRNTEQTAAAWHTFFEDSIRRACSVPAPIHRRGTPSADGFEKCANGRSEVHKTHEQTAAAWHTFFEKCANGRSVAIGPKTSKRPQRGAHF